MKLIYIKSTMEPKDYSTLRSLLKQTQGEKIAPYVFKVMDAKSIQTYLEQEKIIYEIYQFEAKFSNLETKLNQKRPLEEENSEQTRKKRKL